MLLPSKALIFPVREFRDLFSNESGVAAWSEFTNNRPVIIEQGYTWVVHASHFVMHWGAMVSRNFTGEIE